MKLGVCKCGPEGREFTEADGMDICDRCDELILVDYDRLQATATRLLSEIRRLKQPEPECELIPLQRMADKMGLSPRLLRDNADRFGGINLGGDRQGARWFFNPRRVVAELNRSENDPPPTPPASIARARRRRSNAADLLPIKGDRAA